MRHLVLHSIGAEEDRGGILSAVRAIAAAGQFDCILGVAPGFVARRLPALATLELAGPPAEVINARTMLQARAAARRVEAWLNEEPGRIFHAHSRSALLIALHLRRLGCRRVVASVHCFGRRRWFYRWAARQLGSRLYWLTPAMKRYYGVGDGWDRCIPSAVAPSAPVSRVPRAIDSGPVRLAGIGMLVPWKGWHLVLDAMAALPANLRDAVNFSHIGSADSSVESRRYAAELQARTAELGLTRQVRWLGEQDSSRSFLDECDLLIVPSIREPQSLALLEALGAGVPVLASDDGGPSDLLEPGRNGWLFKSGDATALSRELGAILESGAWRNCRITEEDLARFSAQRVAAQWREVYDRLDSLP